MRPITMCILATLLALAGCATDTDDDAGAERSPTPAPTPALATCTNEDAGYTVGYPDEWHTNTAEVVSSCSFFDPEPINVVEGAEPDVAIVLDREDIPYETASAPDVFGRVISRDSATVDGREAVAILHESTGEGLLDAGTGAYVWVVDLGDGSVIASTHDTPERDLQTSIDTLDLMMSNIEFSTPARDDEDDQAAGRSVVARYRGGGLPFTVTAVHSADEICLAARAGDDEGDRSCWNADDLNETLTVRALDVPGDAKAVGGLSAAHIGRVLVGLTDESTTGFRPSSIDGVDVRAWAVPVAQDDVERVIGYTTDRRMAAVLDAQGRSTTVLAGVDTRPESTEPSDEFALLTSVETGLHAGYDRVAFRFRERTPGYDAGYEDRPIREDGSGREVEIEGDAVIEIRMRRASGRERTGDGEETYTGPTRLDASGAFVIREVVRTGDFEGHLTWAIGIRDQLPMRVQVFGDVVVVDVRHPEA